MQTVPTKAGKAYLEVTLIPMSQSVGIARVFVRHHLLSLGHRDLVDDATQIVSELVTNAVAATASHDPRTRGRIRMRLGPGRGRPLLEVWDSSPRLPVIREPGFAAESGRGLYIVGMLAA